MNRKPNTTRLALLAATLAATPLSHAVIVWTGGGGSEAPGIFNSANWDFSASTLTSIAGGNVINDDVIIDSPSVTINVGNSFWLGEGYSFTATNAQFTTANGSGLFRSTGSSGNTEVAPANQAVFQLVNSSADLQRIGTNTTVILDSQSSITVSNATNEGVNTYSRLILDPGASITFSDGSAGNNGLGIAARLFNSLTGDTFLEDYYTGPAGTPSAAADLNDPAYLGAGPQSSFRLTGGDASPFASGDTGAFTITAVPEPAVSLLSSLAAALLVRRRRAA